MRKIFLLLIISSCHSKPHITYRMPDFRENHRASYLIDDSTGRRVTDSGGKMIIDTVHHLSRRDSLIREASPFYGLENNCPATRMEIERQMRIKRNHFKSL